MSKNQNLISSTIHNLAVSPLPEIDAPGQAEGSQMLPLQQARVSPVTSRHEGAEL